jgi:hypothetical protein
MKGRLLSRQEMIARTNIIYSVYIEEALSGEIIYKIYSAEFISDVTLRRLIKFTEFLLSLNEVKDNIYIHINNKIPIILINSREDNNRHGIGVSSMYSEYIKVYMKDKWEILNEICKTLSKEYKKYRCKKEE